MSGTIRFYNEQMQIVKHNETIEAVMNAVDSDETKIKWDQKLYEHALKGEEHFFSEEVIV